VLVSAARALGMMRSGVVVFQSNDRKFRALSIERAHDADPRVRTVGKTSAEKVAAFST